MTRQLVLILPLDYKDEEKKIVEEEGFMLGKIFLKGDEEIFEDDVDATTECASIYPENIQESAENYSCTIQDAFKAKK